jgi:hypothetical protein
MFNAAVHYFHGLTNGVKASFMNTIRFNGLRLSATCCFLQGKVVAWEGPRPIWGAISSSHMVQTPAWDMVRCRHMASLEWAWGNQEWAWGSQEWAWGSPEWDIKCHMATPICLWECLE